MTLTLYTAQGTCALASHIALEEAGAEYELQRLDFSKTEQLSPEYLSINPKARVPTLITARGILTETPAILAFIAQAFPSADLAAQNDPFAFAEVQDFNSYLCSTVHVAHAHRRRGHRWADDSACFDLIEREMLQGPWVMGDSYTVADPYLFTVAQWLEGDGVDLDRIPHVLDHRNRMSKRPAVQKALNAQRKPAVA